MEIINKEHLALGPLDGRYAKIGQKLSPYFSEYALVKNRVRIEVLWLKFLIENVNENILKSFDKTKMPQITNIYENFNEEDYFKVKEIEEITNHDVKAVELFIAEKLKELNLEYLVSFVHIGCTSEDISNPSYSTMISTALKEVWIPTAEKLIEEISNIAKENKDIAMLAHTHGQPATPTTVGKELTVTTYRMKQQLKRISQIKTKAKFNGATGNYSAISVAFPNENWIELSKKFIEEYLELEFNPVTTQIESHDYICNIADEIRHFNNILVDFDLDMWLYISMEYFKQIPVKQEVRK